MPWPKLLNALQRVLSIRFGLKRPNETLARRSVDRKVSEVLRLMQNDNFTEVRMQFVPILRWILTEHVLRKGWELLRVTAGPLVKVGTPIVNEGMLTTAKVPIQFERARLAMVLQMTSSGRLVGLRFTPQRLVGLGASWIPPTYADVSSFEEEDLRLGTGTYKVGGTLSMPKTAGPHPGVVLLSGSGPCDRDSTCEAAKSFKDLAWGLASRGVAVLRFDKVSHTYGATFRSNSSVTLTDEYLDHALDAIRQLQQQPDVGRNCIFIVAHSLGAWVAPRVAGIEPSVAGLVIMAGPAQAMYWSALRQMRYLASLEDGSKAALEPKFEEMQRAAELADSPDLSRSTPVDKLPFGIGAPYWLDARTFDPIGTAKHLQMPIMLLQGGRDYQVTLEDDYSKWLVGLKDHKNAHFRIYEKLNHLFISGQGPSTPLEYDTPGNVEEDVICDLSDWILRNSER